MRPYSFASPAFTDFALSIMKLNHNGNFVSWKESESFLSYSFLQYITLLSFCQFLSDFFTIHPEILNLL